MEQYLRETRMLDFSNKTIQELIEKTRLEKFQFGPKYH